MLRVIFIAVTILAVAACTTGNVATQAHSYLLAYEESNLSSGAILVARGDDIIVREGFGYADVGRRLRNCAETRFRIGSITKSMTWAAIHRLVERGMLDLDDSVAELIGTAALPSDVTIRHLLTHEGGVADWGTFTDSRQFSERASSLEDLTEWVASKPLIFAPGTDRSYSNSGYILLARVIEAVSERPYGAFLSDELFLPLGMNATEHLVEPATAQLARGYVQDHQPTPIVKAPDNHPSILVGSGSIVSTVGDLLIWSRSAEARQFPWDRGNRHGLSVTFMGGFVPGFGAWIEHYSDEDITVIFLTNLNNGAVQKIVPDLGAIVLGGPYEPRQKYRDIVVGHSQRNALSGSWICEGAPGFTIQPAGQRLEILWRHRGPAQPLWAQSDTELFYPQDWAKIAIRNVRNTAVLSYEGPGAPPVACTVQLREQ